MAREATVKVTVDGSKAKSGVKDIESETKKAAKGMKGALDQAFEAGIKGGKDAIKGLVSDVRGAISTIGGLVGGLGVAELARGALEAQSTWNGLRFRIQAAGGSAKDFADVQTRIQKAALASGQDSMKMVAVFDAMREKTGSLEKASTFIDDVGTAARGAHKELADVGDVTAALAKGFGITKREDMQGALADVVGLAEKGGATFGQLAAQLQNYGALAKQAGLQGREGLAQYVGILNVAAKSTGSFESGAAAMNGLIEQLSRRTGKYEVAAKVGISTQNLGKTPEDAIQGILRATGGNRMKLERAFQGDQLKVLLELGKTYAASFEATKGDVKTKTAAASDAVKQAFTAASKSAVGWADISKEAAAEMETGPAKIAAATERLRQAVAKPEVIGAIEKMLGMLPRLASFLGGLASFAATNPGATITAAIVASIAKASIGEAIGSLFKGMGPAGIGLGILATAAAAAAAAIYDYESKATAQQEGLQSTPALVAKAKKQLIETGSVDKDTLDAIARQRAEFEGVRGATGEGGVEKLSYTQILAAKLTGGADQIAAAEATTEEAKRLGTDGVEQLIGELDTILATAAPAKQRPAEEVFGGPGATAVGPPAPPSAQRDAMAAVANLPGLDPAAVASLTGRATADALGGKVIRVRIEGDNGPTGAGAVTPGNVPR